MTNKFKVGDEVLITRVDLHSLSRECDVRAGDVCKITAEPHYAEHPRWSQGWHINGLSIDGKLIKDKEMTKEEALKKIEELKQYVDGCDKEYRPDVGDTVRIKSNGGYDKTVIAGDIAVVRRLYRNGAALYNPKWDASTDGLYFSYNMIEKLEI